MNTIHKHRRLDWLYRRGIFGIPLGLWLLFAVAVIGAAAAWLYLVATASVSVTSQAFGPFTVTSASTQQGSCVTVFTPPDLVAVTWANAAPEPVETTVFVRSVHGSMSSCE